MLDDQEKERIRLEEQAKFLATQEIAQEQERSRAAAEYRAEVRAELHGKRNKKFLLWLILPSLLALGAWGFWHRQTNPENTNNLNGWGGIQNNNLVARCQDAIRIKRNDYGMQFPNTDMDAQITATPDGKRWDGFLINPNSSPPNRIDFSCSYTPQNNQLNLELIKP